MVLITANSDTPHSKNLAPPCIGHPPCKGVFWSVDKSYPIVFSIV